MTNDDLAIEYYTARKAGKKVRAEYFSLDYREWHQELVPDFDRDYEYRLIYEPEPVHMMQLAITEYPAPYRGEMKVGQEYFSLLVSRGTAVIEDFTWDDEPVDHTMRNSTPGIWPQREHAQAYLDCIMSGKEKQG